jgi:hypothetical protein
MTARSHGYRYFFQYEARAVDWKSATKISFFVGCIFLFATAGNPWGFSAVIVPTVMGREIFPATASHLSFGYMIFHVALGILFGLTMAPVLQRLKIVAAIAVSIPFGLLFYAFNYALFHTLFSTHGNSGEIGVLFTNVAFAILFAAAYRGLARGRESMRTVENARQKWGSQWDCSQSTFPQAWVFAFSRHLASGIFRSVNFSIPVSDIEIVVWT